MTGGRKSAIGVWLGAGAVSLGVGAAIASGCGVATADTGSSHSTGHSTSGRPASSSKATAAPTSLKKPTSAVGRTNRTIATTRTPVATATATKAVSWQRRIQEVVNSLVPIINNTPIRNVLNIIDPPSGPGSTMIRLPQQPLSMVFSADGTRAFVLTAPPVTGGVIGPYHYPNFGVVTEINTTNQTVVGVPVIVDGTPNAIVLSEDGTRAYVTTTSSVTVLDTKHCTVVGTIAVGGELTLVPDSTRGYVMGWGYDSGAGKYTTGLTPVDLGNISIAGNTLVLEGIPVGDIAYSPDGKRAYLTTELHPLSVDNAAAVTTIDTVSNSKIGEPLVLDGFPIGGFILSPDGTRASQTNAVGGDTVVTVIDATDSTIVGEPVVIEGVTGTGSGFSFDGIGAMFSADGTRINRIVQRGSSTILTVIDSADASIVGTPVVLPGNRYLSTTAVVPDPDGPLVYILAANDVPGFVTSSVATVVDSSNSTLVGTPVTLHGFQVGDAPLTVSPDGTRVYQTTVLSTGDLPYTTFVYTIGTDSTLVGEVSIPGTGSYTAPALVLKPDGSRVYQLTYDIRYKATMTVIDTTTGATVRSPFTRPGLAEGLTFAPGGAYAYALTTRYGGWPTPYNTRLSVFNASKI